MIFLGISAFPTITQAEYAYPSYPECVYLDRKFHLKLNKKAINYPLVT